VRASPPLSKLLTNDLHADLKEINTIARVRTECSGYMRVGLHKPAARCRLFKQIMIASAVKATSPTSRISK
jgi:hypothetical protein